MSGEGLIPSLWRVADLLSKLIQLPDGCFAAGKDREQFGH
jgi:hypothetical protein